MRNEAKSTLEGRVTRVPICLSAVVKDFFRGLDRGEFSRCPRGNDQDLAELTSVQLRSFRKCEKACRYYGEEGFDLVIDLEDGWRLAG